MKTCIACGHTQEEGNFCGKCGTNFEGHAGETVYKQKVADNDVSQAQLETAATQESSTHVNESQKNEQLEKIKEQSKRYFDYFIQQLKSPSTQVNGGQTTFKNSLISIALYILLTIIAVYSLFKGLLGGYDSFYGYFGPSLFQLFVYMSIFFILLIGINLLAIFVTSKLFSVNQNFKEIIGNVGGYFAIPVVFSVIGILLAILKSLTIATFFIYIGVSIAFGLIPLFVMLKLLNIKSKRIDSFYAFLFYLFFTFVSGLLLGLLIADSAIGELLNYL